MDCRRFNQRLNDMLDNELPASEQIEMLEHIRSCSDCAAIYDRALQIMAKCGELQCAEPPAELFESVMNAIKAEPAPGKAKSARKWYSRPGIWACSGVAACFVIVAAIMLSGGGVTPRSPVSESYMMDYAVSPGYATSSSMRDTGVTTDYDYQKSESAMLGSSNFSADIATEEVAYDMEMPEPVLPPSGDAAQYGKKIILNGSIRMESTAFDDDLTNIEAVIASYGGYKQSATVSGRPLSDTNDYGRSSYYSVRVPSESYLAVVEAIKQYGAVLDYSEYTDDVTSQYYDTQARLDAYNAQYTKIKALLNKAETLDETLRIEEELSRIQYQIDSLTGTLKYWDNQVSYSTLSLSMQEVRNPSAVKKVDPTLGERIKDGFIGSINAIVSFAEHAVVWLASSIIPLIIIAAVAIVVFIIVRNSIKAKKAAAKKD